MVPPKRHQNAFVPNKTEDDEIEMDDITIINPTQPYTLKDGHYMVIGAPPLLMNNQMEVDDPHTGFDPADEADDEYDDN